MNNNFAKLADLFTECFERLYPDQINKSPGAKAIQKHLREFALEHELLDAAETLRQHAITVDLRATAYQALQQAAGRSHWIPPEYTANEWIADCINFLHHGHPKPAKELEGRPINMVLHCPVCHTQHVDRAETPNNHSLRYKEEMASGSQFWNLYQSLRLGRTHRTEAICVAIVVIFGVLQTCPQMAFCSYKPVGRQIARCPTTRGQSHDQL